MGTKGSAQRERELAAKRAAQKKRKRKLRAAARLILVLLIFAGVCVSLYAVCKIKSVSVTGGKTYTEQEIIEASGIKQGGSMFLLSSKKTERAIYEKLSYVESASIIKKFPYDVEIEIEEVGENCAVELKKGYAIVSKSLKVLSSSKSLGAGIPLITGVEVSSSKVGARLESEDADKLTYLERLLTLLSDEGLLDKVNSVDISDTLNISLLYDGRISVMIGTASSLDYKIAMMKEVVTEKLYPADVGKLNLSTAGKAVFSPERVEDESAEPDQPADDETRSADDEN